MSDTVFQAAALIVPLILAIVFHEVAHGWVARALGDPTAAEMNRLSLNPLRHVDPVGTIVLPGFLALIKAPVLGWAKPVPVNKYRLNNPRLGMMAVAAAGPATNLVMAAVGAVLLGLLLRPEGGLHGASALGAFLAANLINFLLINVFVALFNLLPIPPFDGSHIVEGLLPRQAARRYARLRPLRIDADDRSADRAAVAGARAQHHPEIRAAAGRMAERPLLCAGPGGRGRKIVRECRKRLLRAGADTICSGGMALHSHKGALP